MTRQKKLTRIEVAAIGSTIAAAALIAFLSHRLVAAGESGDVFQTSATDFRAIQSTSQGVPGAPAYADDPVQIHSPLTDKALAASKLIHMTRPHNERFDRFDAISELGASDDANAELTLVSLLDDPDPTIRESAVESLAYRGTEGAIRGMGYALGDSEPLVRLAALEFLAEIGTPDALAMLAGTLSDAEADLRLAAVYELADVEDESAHGLLQQFLSDSDANIRQTAAELLGD